MKIIDIGSTAPIFNAKDINNENINLSNFLGKKVLLSFHPLAWTPVCTDQMRALENNFKVLKELNCVPLGFSVDAPPSKKAWSVAINISNVSLPSDFWPHGMIAKAYGVFNEEKGVSERANIIIDEKGKVAWTKSYYTQQLPDINEIINVLSNMQHNISNS